MNLKFKALLFLFTINMANADVLAKADGTVYSSDDLMNFVSNNSQFTSNYYEEEDDAINNFYRNHQSNIRNANYYAPAQNYQAIPYTTSSSGYGPASYAVYDFKNHQFLEQKGINDVRPIASVTKLMTANVFLKLNGNNGYNCATAINDEDTDRLKGTRTRLPKNVPIGCNELLHAMLISSDNYAASALARSIPNMSKWQFIQEMNKQAREWGMNNTHFEDSSGLNPRNVSSVNDLIKLAQNSLLNPTIKQITAKASAAVNAGNIRQVAFNNSNKLVRTGQFAALLSKTGHISEAGYNLVFVNGRSCNGRTIGVISLRNGSSDGRASFTRSKLEQYGCY